MRVARLSLPAFLICIAILFFVSTSLAQLPQASDTTSPPTPGVGHDYIHAPQETVNPANGSVSIRIPLRVPSGRGLTVPLSIAYDSAGAFYFGELVGSLGTDPPNYNTITNVPFSRGGWSYTFPMMTNTREDWTQECTGGKTCGCHETVNYVLQDPSGNRHNMGLVGIADPLKCGSAITQGGEGPILATLSGATPTVTDGNGTLYSFPAFTYYPNYLLPTSITDSNGNTASIATSGTPVSSASVTDTLGRTVISVPTFGSNPDNISLAGLASPYQVSWTTASPSFTISQTPLGIPGFAPCPTSLSGSANVISQIVLPNGQKFTFIYNSTYGMLTRITYPTGGYVRYTWGLNSQPEAGTWSSWGCRYDFPAITDRYVSFDGSTEVLHQHFAYNTTWPAQGGFYTSKTTTVTTYDLVHNSNSATVYAYVAVSAPCVPDQNPNTSGCLGSVFTGQIPLEQCIEYYDSSGSGGTPPSSCPNLNPPGKLLRTVIKSWPNNDPRTLGSIQTVLDNGQSSLIVHCYNSSEEVTETDAYDLGTSTPTLPSCANGVPSGTVAGPLLKKTTTSYATFTGAHIVDLPSSVIAYDGSGNRLAETDSSYDQTALQSTSVVQHTSAPGGSARGNLTTLTKQCFNGTCGGGNPTTTYSFYDTGQIYQLTDPRSNVTTYSYTDSYSSCGGNAPPSGATNAYLTQVAYPQTNGVNHVASYCYDYSAGLLRGSTDQNGQTTNYTYADSLDRLTQTSYPDGGQVTYSYNDTPPSPTQTAAKKLNSSQSVTTVTTMNGLGAAVKTQLTSDPQGTITNYKTLDGLGRDYQAYNPYRSVSDPTYGYSSYVYDALGRTTSITKPDNSVISTNYSGNCTTVTDEAGKSHKSCTDGLARLTQVFEDPGSSPHLNYETDYTYDLLDNLLTVNQKGGSTNSANWRARTFTYDSLSRLTQAVNPESGSISYSYDANGNLLTKTSPKPNQTGSATVVTTYAYDALNRLTQKSYNDGSTPTVSYVYDSGAAPAGCTLPTLTITNGISRRTGMCDAAGSEAWSYDSVGRPLTDKRTTNSISQTTSYTYNLDGSIATLTYPSGRVITYTYNAAARPLSAVDTANSINYATAASYVPQGALSSLTNGASLISTLYFNSRLQPCRISVKSSGTAPSTCTDTATGNVLDFTYGFNLGSSDNGNVASLTNNRDTTRSQSFSYDSLNRLATAKTSSTSGANCWDENFGYDPWANLLSIGRISGYTCSNEELLSVGATTNNQVTGDTYDAAGNLITIPSVASFTYNAENQLLTAGGVTYTYDGDGRRVQKSNGKLYWYGMGSDPLDETDLTGSITNSSFKEYVFFAGKRIASRDYQNNVSYYFSDHLGTARSVASSSGSVLDDSDFYPFGGERVIASSSGNHYKFTGKERDSESGLDNFGARYLTSSMGRFMSPDPDNAGEIDENPQSWNGYAYALNNPLRYRDPDGTNVLVCIDGQSKCHNYTDDQYARLLQEQNGKQGINLPNQALPHGDITCGGVKCGTATYFEPGMESANGMNFAIGGLFKFAIEGGISLLEGIFGSGARTAGQVATSATSNAVQGPAQQIVGNGTKQAVRDALESSGLSDAAKATIKGALRRGAAGDSYTVEKLADGSVTITREVAGQAGGRAAYEQVIDGATGATKSVVQKAYDASGNLVHVDPKFP